MTLLSKSLLPLPEKFHGLTNTELRYRQRYVDLIVNPEVKRNFVIRSQFIKHVRTSWTPGALWRWRPLFLNTISGGATARPFITHHNTLDIDMYMRIATELPLKRLIVGGMDRVYGSAASSATRAWTPSTTRSSPPSSCIRPMPTSTT